jgi:D-beta-D-heptose 7-phosphate kinase/D-beta-D-heptose 1-phosphate adenosyltransferase
MRINRRRPFIAEKIKTLAGLKQIVSRLKKQGKRIVFTNGCFDLLHAGHVVYLEDAKRKGDCLVVAINSDASVRRLKGAPRPITKEADRARVLAALHSVDYVVLFGEDTPYAVIQEIKPNILIKGGDWPVNKIVGADLVKSYGGTVACIPYIPGHSSTNIIARCAHK